MFICIIGIFLFLTWFFGSLILFMDLFWFTRAFSGSHPIWLWVFVHILYRATFCLLDFCLLQSPLHSSGYCCRNSPICWLIRRFSKVLDIYDFLALGKEGNGGKLLNVKSRYILHSSVSGNNYQQTNFMLQIVYCSMSDQALFVWR